jgi:hypothetical protein
MPVKAYIYAEDGALLGYMAYQDVPPDVLDLNGRYFEQHGRSSENQDDDDCNVQCFDYWEIEIEKHMDVIYICVGCGRNSSICWYKCCPDHVDLDGPEVYCQACVEKLHPGDPDFIRN